MSLKAYKAAQVATEDPRVTEYRLFGQVTGALLTAKESKAEGSPLVDAVDWNSRATHFGERTAAFADSERTCV